MPPMHDPSEFNHPHCSTPEEYEEHKAAMNELCDSIERETPDPLPKDFSDWAEQEAEHFKKRFGRTS